MGLSHQRWVRILGKDQNVRGVLSDPIRMGALPFELRPFKNMIPTLMHGKRITFGDKISEDFGTRTRRVFKPTVFYRPFWSRTLGMMVWCRAVSQVLRTIDRVGGFDEYMVTTNPRLIDCDIAKMYRKKILEGMAAKDPLSKALAPAQPKQYLATSFPEDRFAPVEEKKVRPMSGPDGMFEKFTMEEDKLLAAKYGEEYVQWVFRDVFLLESIQSLICANQTLRKLRLAREFMSKKVGKALNVLEEELKSR
ncbi:39S ribosomal protein L24, mitochondrial [Borealophlyctis nickersoniae]|nr:39S ribosomal protein L24, mitochondrial [Borealophlyctis nickersoniae]